jgi:hypothetical protein
MSSDNPDQPPAPGVLARMCARAAWRNDIDDDVRLLLEWASDTIKLSEMQRCLALCRAEHLEAVNQTLKGAL